MNAHGVVVSGYKRVPATHALVFIPVIVLNLVQSQLSTPFAISASAIQIIYFGSVAESYGATLILPLAHTAPSNFRCVPLVIVDPVLFDTLNGSFSATLDPLSQNTRVSRLLSQAICHTVTSHVLVVESPIRLTLQSDPSSDSVTTPFWRSSPVILSNLANALSVAEAGHETFESSCVCMLLVTPSV